jgi:ethanolamine utilization protein EutN
MYTGKVVGSVVSTIKDKSLQGIKLLVVQTLENGKPAKLIVAADEARVCGVGDHVYLIGSKEAAMALGKGLFPVDASIVGIVDEFNVGLKFKE